MSVAPQHSSAFRRRRFFNWAPLGFTYAFLYMGRYNLTVAKNALGDLMSLEQFGTIFGVGTAVYAFAFGLNGPLTDKLGGRFAILMGAAGSAVCNFAMGWYVRDYLLGGAESSPTFWLSILYALNMYFQSFGAVAVVKVNSSWFHVTERGTFSAIFGSIISLGIFLAFDVGQRIVNLTEGFGEGGIDATWWVFFVPSAILVGFFILDWFLVRNQPSEAGQQDFDTGAARIAGDDQPIPTMVLLKRILTNPIILTVALIEFCTGVVRNGVMHWYPIYTKVALVLPSQHFMRENWGLILFVAGVAGGAFAGLVSDKLFQSRRGPAAAALYFGIAVCLGAMIFSLGGTKPEVGWISKPITEAQQLGLRSGDLIVAIGDNPIVSRTLFIAEVEKPGEYTLSVLREGKPTQVVLPSSAPLLAALRLRSNLTTIDGVDHGGKSVRALHWKGQWAAEAGLQQSDRVLLVNGSTPEDWESTLEALHLDGAPNTLVVERSGTRVELEVRYPPHAPKSPEERARFVSAGPVQITDPMLLGALAFLVSLCVIGTHGLLSGTATMDFGGRRGAGTAVAVIDGFVYLGTALQSFSLGFITSRDWFFWPIFLLPFGVLGFVLCLRIWHAHPSTSKGGGH
jgi:sugar phosphate permease